MAYAVTVERRLHQGERPYLIVTRRQGMADDEVTTFSGPNADARAAVYVKEAYPDKDK